MSRDSADDPRTVATLRRRTQLRSPAPVPQTPSPRKPTIPLLTPARQNASNHREQSRLEAPPSTDKKPLVAAQTLSPVGDRHATPVVTRYRSQAPEAEPSKEWIRSQIKEELENYQHPPRFYAREPTWLETGGGNDDHPGSEEPPLFLPETEDHEQAAVVGAHDDDGEPGEIDYGDEPDPDREPPASPAREDSSESEEPQEESTDEEADSVAKRKRAKRYRDEFERSQRTELRRKRKRLELERAKEEEARELAQLNTQSEPVAREPVKKQSQELTIAHCPATSFLDSLGVDPRPTQVSLKARLTNEIAAKTSHFPAPHQVLAVKEPPSRYPRSPTPPPPLRSRRGAERRSTLEPKKQSPTPLPLPHSDGLEDDVELEEYVEETDNVPPEHLLHDTKDHLQIDVLVDKPRRLETKEEAIKRWKEETDILTPRAREVPQ